MTSPLEGLRVLDLSRVLAGPFAGRMLADLGADVVKVEPPDGDVTRLWGLSRAGISGYYFQQNAGKRCISVDLTRAEGSELIQRLAARADVLVENFRPGVMERLGVGYETLAAQNPRLVMLSISGFGAEGPESLRAAYAPIVHAELGLVQRQSERSGARPMDLVVSLADTNAALHGLVAVLSALLLRGRTGKGQHIDLAMVDASLVTDDRLHYALDGVSAAEPHNSEVWETAGGELMIAGDFRFVWKQLVAHCGLADPTPEAASLEEKIDCRRRAAAVFFTQTCTSRADVIDALDRMNIAWGDVRPRTRITELPTVGHRGSLVEVDDRAGGRRPIAQSPYRFSDADAHVRGGAPHRGEHNRVVLEEWLGLDAAGIDRYRAALSAALPDAEG